MASEATTANLPFGMGEVDLTSMSAVWVILSLVLGWAVFSMSQDIGEVVKRRVTAFIASLTGFNPTTGDNSGMDVV